MSALTDLFTALANKIRSKTGGSDTYTPPEMVDAIDDVYDAGEAAGVAATKVGNAAAGDVLSGKTFTNSTTVGESGSMTNNGAVSATLNTSTTSYTVPAGYHNGSGTVSITTQTKSATPSTSAQTIDPDAGKVLSSVSVGAIPGEYIIPSGNKAITANGTGIDVSSYATASVSVSGTSITPSNSSPASMTSGTLYTPSANGYAISSYNSTTPSNSSPVSLSSGSIHKMGGAGYAISSYSSITPSNSSPASMSSGSIYKAGAAGYAISSYSSVTPSDSSPVSLTSGSIYKMGGAGKAVASVTTLTPSDTTPASVSSGGVYKASAAGYAISSYSSSGLTPSTSGQYFSSGWNRMTSSGYAYSSKPTSVQTKSGTFTTSSSQQSVTVNCGFQPTTIIVLHIGSNGSLSSFANGSTLTVYSSSIGSYQYCVDQNTGGSKYIRVYALSTSNDYATITATSSTGFTFRSQKSTSSAYQGTYYYFAVG